jgi:predicted DsbA family dithiol-disulfide isomerase
VRACAHSGGGCAVCLARSLSLSLSLAPRKAHLATHEAEHLLLHLGGLARVDAVPARVLGLLALAALLGTGAVAARHHDSWRGECGLAGTRDRHVAALYLSLTSNRRASRGVWLKMNAPRLLVEIVSDTVCPWCYVGRRRLGRALDLVAVASEIRWRPFQLNPKMGPSVDKQGFYKLKFGEARSKLMLANMLEVGKQEGINFSFGGKTGNTRDSHRLIAFAEPLGKQDEMVNVLFRYYFEQEKDISDLDTLVEAAREAGIDADKAREMLHSKALVAEVEQQCQEAYEREISGVPHFTLRFGDARPLEVGGAQEPGTFLMAFRRLGVPLKQPRAAQ